MPSPFPGMDPYIERPEIFPDFHAGFIIMLRSGLQPLLRPRYIALTEDRLYVVEMLTETIRESVLHIIEPAAGNRIVTAIEILSPDNKATGAGREAYLQKRAELTRGGSNFVEIDLLRRGLITIQVTTASLESSRPWHYLVAVSRRQPARQEFYPFPLQHRLPRIRIPLTADDADVIVDLQAVFARSWEEGPYPELLRYDGPPPGPMADDELAWCDNVLREAGYRSALPANGTGST